MEMSGQSPLDATNNQDLWISHIVTQDSQTYDPADMEQAHPTETATLIYSEDSLAFFKQVSKKVKPES